MTSATPELQEILSTLEALRSRVDVLSAGVGPADVPGEPKESLRDRLEKDPRPSEPIQGAWGLDAAHVATLLDGISALNQLHQQREFPEFFSRFAKQNGLRLLLLKRWTSGLQVYLEVGVQLPPEARKKRSDGRAPIPITKADIFAAVAEETAVYAGPVPARNFPLDLTLMLGRGARDRGIVILPLPSQGHWNTFLYLDGDDGAGQGLVLAEILAHYALNRMYLLEKGVHLRQGRVEEIFKTEYARRGGRRRSLAPEPDPQANEATQPQEQQAIVQYSAAPQGNFEESGDAAAPEPVIDPFTVRRKADQETAPGQYQKQDPSGQSGDEGGASHLREQAELTSAAGDIARPLTPEDILHHSGELPALPKVACHIMAVIEDPKTTATRLEKALAMDQTLTAKVLRIANSPFYGAVREIKTVSESIVRLGFVAIRNWTLVTAARSVFLGPGAGVLYRKIWKQSVMSAMAGQLVAQTASLRDPESVFIGGLMQNIGQLVLARSHPELFQEILLESTSTGKPYHVIERDLLGFDHGELGALLIQEWNLSSDLEDAVRWHHRFKDPEAHNVRVAAMIALGEEIAWCSGAGENDHQASSSLTDDEPQVSLSAAAQYLGFSANKVAELGRQAAELKIDPHFFT